MTDHERIINRIDGRLKELQAEQKLIQTNMDTVAFMMESDNKAISMSAKWDYCELRDKLMVNMACQLELYKAKGMI